MQVRISPELNGILDTASTISVRRGHFWVGVEHVFEALLRSPELLPQDWLAPHAHELATLLSQLQQSTWRGAVPAASDVYYTPRCAAAVSQAPRLAERMHSSVLAAGHLMLALLIDADSGLAQSAARVGVHRGPLILDLRAALGHKPERAAELSPETGSSKGLAAATATAEQSTERIDPDIAQITTDLTQLAREGRIEPAIGRDQEMLQVVEVLARRSKNNVILTGEAGVGKTKIIEGLAAAAAKGQLGSLLAGKRILQLDMGSLLAGTQYRGALEEKLVALLRELKDRPDTMLFIDEIHLIMGAGAVQEGSVDVANLLKPALARGEIRCIGATTVHEYRKFIERDPAIERRFQMLRIEPLSDDATYELLKSLRSRLSHHHGVYIGRPLLRSIISLTKRYMPNRQLPDKAIDVLDQACARFRLKMQAAQDGLDYSITGLPKHNERPELTLHEIRKVISQQTGIPIDELTAAERMQLENLAEQLRRHVIGQDEAIAKVVAAVKKSRAGLADPNRPESIMLFVGPTGVGKTELVKELCRILFGSVNHLIAFDMSEYIEEHSVAKLLGSPPGYAGSDEEGRLTGAVKNAPFSILLFDEIEKAHPRVLDIFLPVFDEGRLKDSRGREVSFRNCIIVMTSNVGADLLLQGDRAIGDSAVVDVLTEQFRPEFINRVDELVPFYPLMFEDVRAILKVAMDQFRLRLLEKKIKVRVFQEAYEYIGARGYSRELGARELKRTLERLVINPIGEKIVSGEIVDGDTVDVMMHEGRLSVAKQEAEHV